MKIQTAIMSFIYLSRLLLSLFALYVMLSWKVRSARKAFEKQLVRQGMSKKDARKISAQFSKLKDGMMDTVKGSLFRNR
jgi:hypothetical protein